MIIIEVVAYVCQGGFAVIDVGNHGHVPDVELVVHDGTHLLGGKVHLHLQSFRDVLGKGVSRCTVLAIKWDIQERYDTGISPWLRRLGLKDRYCVAAASYNRLTVGTEGILASPMGAVVHLDDIHQSEGIPSRAIGIVSL